jgi:GNAT superfamily N-acetyltransferase
MSELATRLSVRLIDYCDVVDNPALLEAHRAELATHKDLMEVAPDVAAYESMSQSGMLFVLGAFEGLDLVGYSSNIVHQALHYSRLRLCENDLLFLDPAYRSVGNGRALLQRTRLEARLRGAKMMIWHAKPDTPLYHLLVADGCGVQDILLSEVL